MDNETKSTLALAALRVQSEMFDELLDAVEEITLSAMAVGVPAELLAEAIANVLEEHLATNPELTAEEHRRVACVATGYAVVRLCRRRLER